MEFKITNEIDYVFEEQGNQLSAFRQIQWNKGTPRMEIRRWSKTPEGKEIPLKGMTFLTKEGPDELVNVLTKNGIGDTLEVLKNLSKREDFEKCLNSVVGKDSEFYKSDAGTVEDDYFNIDEIIGCDESNVEDD